MINGFINLYKPRGMGSNYALRRVKRLMGQKKAGFLGTLDPMAEGVLPIALGEATKTLYYMEDAHKTYVFTIKFGVETDTLDADGEVIKEGGRVPSDDEIEKILPQFLGEIMQTPPKFSAVHIDGKRAYHLAAAGKDFEIKPRRQQIFSIEYLGEHTFKVEVDRGFYIRSLAADIAFALGTIGHLTYLKRTREGVFLEEASITLDRIEKMLQNAPHSQDARNSSFVLPPSFGLDGIPVLTANKAEATAFRQGKTIPTRAASGLYQVFGDDKFLAIARADKGLLKPERVFNF